MRASTIVTLSACTVASIFPTSSFAETTFNKDGRTFTTRYVDLEKDPDARIRTFGTVEPTLEEQAVLNKAHIDWMQSKENSIFSFDTDKKRVPTIIHIVKPSETSTANEAEGKEQDQMDVLNAAFENNTMGFVFDLVGINTHVSQDYWADGNKDSMVEATREGGMETLNIWFVQLAGNILGYATFPFPSSNSLDGVVNLHSVVNGGTLEPYNLGATTVQGVGYWLGLYHTFQGGCLEPGDNVADTPAEKSPTFGCPGNKPDTCPLDPGNDPIHNYMDYTDDQCMYQFTNGQALRANSMWDTYRAGDTSPTYAPTIAPTDSNPPSSNSSTSYITFSPSIAPTNSLSNLSGCAAKGRFQFSCEEKTKRQACVRQLLCKWKNKGCLHICDNKSEKACRKPRFKKRKVCKLN